VEIPIPTLARLIEMDMAAIGFTVSRPFTERHGVCAACQHNSLGLLASMVAGDLNWTGPAPVPSDRSPTLLIPDLSGDIRYNITILDV
jgi:hypothetical protein